MSLVIKIRKDAKNARATAHGDFVFMRGFS
jgi:hypothetical protein